MSCTLAIEQKIVLLGIYLHIFTFVVLTNFVSGITCTSLCSCSPSLTFPLFPLVVITMVSNFCEVVLPFENMFLLFWSCFSRLFSALLLVLLFWLFLGGSTILSVLLILSRLLILFLVSLLLLFYIYQLFIYTYIHIYTYIYIYIYIYTFTSKWHSQTTPSLKQR